MRTQLRVPDEAWEHFDHGADVGVRGYGSTLEAAFEQTALALTAVVADPASVLPRERVDVVCRAPDRELLLVDWLNAVVHEMACRRMLFARYRVAIGEGELRGSAWGELVEPERHTPAVEVKGATLTALRVAPTERGWVAQCVVDV